MADVARIEIEQDEIGWVLRVNNPGMRTQEYRCATKEQAEKLGEVMTGVRQAAGSGAARPAAKPAPVPAAAPAPAAKPPVRR